MIVGRARAERERDLWGTGDSSSFRVDGRAPCILALHGFTGSVAELRPVLDVLAAHGYAIEAPLLPGHATRATDLQAVDVEGLLDVAINAFDATRARYSSVVVLGFSMGSLLATHVAAERANGVAGLIVIGNALRLAWHSAIPLSAIHALGVKMPDWYLRKGQRANIVDDMAGEAIVSYDRHPLRAALGVYRLGLRVRREVPRVTCPTLVLHGGRDLVCPVSNVELYRKLVGSRDVTTRVYPSSAHVVPADVDRAEVARDVRAFVERVSTPVAR